MSTDSLNSSKKCKGLKFLNVARLKATSPIENPFNLRGYNYSSNEITSGALYPFTGANSENGRKGSEKSKKL